MPKLSESTRVRRIWERINRARPSRPRAIRLLTRLKFILLEYPNEIKYFGIEKNTEPGKGTFYTLKCELHYGNQHELIYLKTTEHLRLLCALKQWEFPPFARLPSHYPEFKDPDKPFKRKRERRGFKTKARPRKPRTHLEEPEDISDLF